MNSIEDRLNKSKIWTILYIAFILSFIALIVLLTERVIEEGSHEVEDITIILSLVIVFLIIVFSLGLLLLFWGAENRQQLLIKIKYIIFISLLICVSGLGWSLRGVWGHETGTLVWGTLLFSILMLENKRDHWITLIFFAILGLSIGANLPFANYPFIPRLLLFATWGMLGCFTAAFGRYVFYGKRFKTQEDLKKFHIEISLLGFLGLAIGITFASAFYLDEGWMPGWIGGYVTGIFYGIILGIYLYYNNKKYKEELETSEFLSLYNNIVEPSSKPSKFLKFLFYLTILGVVPVIGIINAAGYNYEELGYKEFPLLLMIALGAVYIIIALILILKFFNKLGKLENKYIELSLIFLPTLWLSSIGAILRHNTGQFPDLFYIITSFEFELSVVYFTILASILFGLYLLINRLIEKRK